MFITRVFLSCSVLSIINLAYTATLRMRGEYGPPIERACQAHIPDQSQPLEGKCRPKGQCSRYISLPASHGKKAPCDTITETCCIKKLCDLSSLVSVPIANPKYYCTNAQNQMEAINSDDQSHVLLIDGDRHTNPVLPYVIPNFEADGFNVDPCPGPALRNWLGGINDGAMVCLIDSPMTLSIKGNSQTPTTQGVPQSAIGVSDVVADNFLDNEGDKTTFDEQIELLPYK